MQTVFTILLTVLGGLGIFLLGMKHLSEGLQTLAGSGLRKFMSLATSHRLMGVFSGIVSTILVQSSSIVTVMLVGFVSSAIMTLPQAFSVLIGANIGTTATVWIIAYAPNPQMLGFFGLAIGGALYFFLRGEKLHHLGLTLMGLGLVFLGLYFMSKGVSPIRNDPSIAKLFQSLDATRFTGILLIALVSALVTAVIQSSAATVAIAMTLVSQLTEGSQDPILSYEAAIAVLFGANIGTTATGWIATIGGTADARRTALSHTLSNLIGSVVLILFFPLFVKFGQTLFPNWNEIGEVVVSGHTVPARTHVMAPIAVTDTFFAFCRGLIFFPLVNPFVRFIERLIKQPENEKPHLSKLTLATKIAPVIACDQALKEVQFMRDSDLELLTGVREVLLGTSNKKLESHIAHRETVLDSIQREITEYLGSILSKRLALDVAARARLLLRLTDELESVSDDCAQILRVVRRLRDQNQQMSDVSVGLLLDVHDRVVTFATEISNMIRSPRPVIDLVRFQVESSAIHSQVREGRRQLLLRVGPEDPGSSLRVLAELDILNAYVRMRSYYLNCAEALAGGKK